MQQYVLFNIIHYPIAFEYCVTVDKYIYLCVICTIVFYCQSDRYEFEIEYKYDRYRVKSMYTALHTNFAFGHQSTYQLNLNL